MHDSIDGTQLIIRLRLLTYCHSLPTSFTFTGLGSGYMFTFTFTGLGGGYLFTFTFTGLGGDA